jgi:hypothetical protein
MRPALPHLHGLLQHGHPAVLQPRPPKQLLHLLLAEPPLVYRMRSLVLLEVVDIEREQVDDEDDACTRFNALGEAFQSKGGGLEVVHGVADEGEIEGGVGGFVWGIGGW